MPGTDIFLSYARHDRAVAQIFAERFAEEGFTVWWDGSLQSGQTFDEVIERNLREARAVVVLWSPRSVASRWVRAEATQADRRNKLAPAIIEPCDRPIIFELTHAAELSDWRGDVEDIRWRTFVHDLRRLVDTEDQQVSPSTAGPVSRARSSPANGLEESPIRAQAASRRPLRPGNDEVIYTGPRHFVPPVEQAQADIRPEQSTEAEAEQADAHFLSMSHDELSDEQFVVDPAGAKIGRTAPADIVIPHKSVSRQHCMIGIANDELLVTDLNSTNGTFIDGERIRRATVLPVGSVLRVGQISMMHSIRAPASADWRGSLGSARRGGGLREGRLAPAR